MLRSLPALLPVLLIAGCAPSASDVAGETGTAVERSETRSAESLAKIAMTADVACPEARHAETSARLRAIREADQADRMTDSIDWGAVSVRDRERRAAVGAIFAEGCLKTGQDFHDAALVYQHGNVPEHYRQTVLWAQEAVARGDETASWLIPRGIDRHLMSVGYKQLFGTNTQGPAYDMDGNLIGTLTGFCLPQTVGEDFDPVRVRLDEPTLAEVRAKLAERNANTGGDAPDCEEALATPPKGMFAGIW